MRPDLVAGRLLIARHAKHFFVCAPGRRERTAGTGSDAGADHVDQVPPAGTFCYGDVKPNPHLIIWGYHPPKPPIYSHIMGYETRLLARI